MMMMMMMMMIRMIVLFMLMNERNHCEIDHLLYHCIVDELKQSLWLITKENIYQVADDVSYDLSSDEYFLLCQCDN